MYIKNGLIKKTISCLLIIILALSSIPLSEISYASLDAGDGIKVDSIRLVREHTGYTTVSAYVEITGSGLAGANVLFEKLGIGGGYQLMGTSDPETGSDGFLKYIFTAEDALLLSGNVRIGNKNVSLNLGNFPTLSSVGQETINVDSNDDLVLTGTNLDSIKVSGAAVGVKAEFGRILSKEFFYGTTVTDSPTTI
ncbi:MAG: hypothetical protein WBA54_12030, partial [Acidaminobacteraceae bacterium]